MKNMSDKTDEGQAFDTSAYLANLSDAELHAATAKAVEDCKLAGATEQNSEWHESCFAACVVFSQEMSRRGLHLNKLH